MVGEFGVSFQHYWLGTDATLEAVRVVQQLNVDPAVQVILVLRPLPCAVSEGEVFRALVSDKFAIPLRPHLARLAPTFGR